MTPLFPNIPSKESVAGFFKPSAALKKKLRATRNQVSAAIKQTALDLILESSSIVDTMVELRKLTREAMVDLRPLVEAEVENQLFPKVKSLTPGDLVYYRPLKARVATTPPSQRATMSTSVFKTFVYTFDGVYVPSPRKKSPSSASTSEELQIPTIMYTQSRDIPPEAVLMFIGYGHAESSVWSGATPVTKAMDYLHSKATVLYNEKVYVVGFPKLPWTKFFIPDDVLAKIDNQVVFDENDVEKTGGSPFLATLF